MPDDFSVESEDFLALKENLRREKHAFETIEAVLPAATRNQKGIPPRLNYHMSRGRGHEVLALHDGQTVKPFLDNRIWEWRLLSWPLAIWNPREGKLEVELTAADSAFQGRDKYILLWNACNGTSLDPTMSDIDRIGSFLLPSKTGEYASIGPSSASFALIMGTLASDRRRRANKLGA